MEPLKRLWRDLVLWLGLDRPPPSELEVIRRKQLKLLEVALRLENGSPIRASSLLLGTGSRWSLEFLVDGYDLLETTSQHIAAHLKKKDREKRGTP